MDSGVNVVILFDGVWEVRGETLVYTKATSSVITMRNDITYLELLDKLYDALAVDRSLFELKLEVPYTCGGYHIPVTVLRGDDDVGAFLREICISFQRRVPLCVTRTQKNIVAERMSPAVSINSEPYVNNDKDNADLNVENEEVRMIENEVSLPAPSQWQQSVRSSNRPAECEDQSKSRAPLFTVDHVEPSSTQVVSSCCSSGEIFTGKVFESKLDLKTKTHVFAMKNNFEFLVKRSSTDTWYIKCKEPSCHWRLRGKKLARSEMFEITAYNSEHTCSPEVRQNDHRQAAPWVVGHLIKNKFATDGMRYMANNIREDMKKQYGISLSYEKAWRCREKAISYVRGTVEASYSKLPAYLYMLQQKNPGTLTDFVIDEGRFLYCFFSLGACRRGFSSCRPVICVDGTFLKTKYGDHMLCAVALDANSQLYPIAFAIVDGENHNSWTYFMRKLKEAIGDMENLAFVSDRHASITHALDLVFPNAYHGACYHHISMNVVAKFKTDHCHEEMWLAAYAFRKVEFETYFQKIRQKDPAIAEYLEGIGFDKWSRAHFPGNRYNIMTSNYAESFNNKTREARTFPITSFVEFIRFTIQCWFSDRRDKAGKSSSRMAPVMEEDLNGIAEKAKYLQVYGIGQYEFQVMDGDRDGEVNLVTKTCTCGMFQSIGIPCVHAVATAKLRNVNIYSLCSPYYYVESWRTSYADSIYPCGNEDEWIVPINLMNMDIGVPIEKNPVGRPKKKNLGRPKIKRLPSQSERIVTERKCSRCGGRGHNRASCKARI